MLLCSLQFKLLENPQKQRARFLQWSTSVFDEGSKFRGEIARRVLPHAAREPPWFMAKAIVRNLTQREAWRTCRCGPLSARWARRTTRSPASLRRRGGRDSDGRAESWSHSAWNPSKLLALARRYGYFQHAEFNLEATLFQQWKYQANFTSHAFDLAVTCYVSSLVRRRWQNLLFMVNKISLMLHMHMAGWSSSEGLHLSTVPPTVSALCVCAGCRCSWNIVLFICGNLIKDECILGCAPCRDHITWNI